MIRSLLKNLLPFGFVQSIQKRNASRAVEKSQRDFNQRIDQLLNDGRPINLELGSGAKKGNDTWTTMDLHPASDIPYNLLQPLPFPDSSVDKIYSSHFLEHFHTKDILKILTESYRVLKPGGWISACVPDGAIYIRAYASKVKLDPDIWLRYKPAAKILSDIDIVNYMAYMDDEHRHLFDIDNLCAMFREAGFLNVKPRKFIAGLDLEVRDYQSIYVEASK